MIYRVEFDTKNDWCNADQQDAAIIKAAHTLRARADQLELQRRDDLMFQSADGRQGLQGWWSK